MLWLNLMLSEISQTWKDKYSMTLLIMHGPRAVKYTEKVELMVGAMRWEEGE